MCLKSACEVLDHLCKPRVLSPLRSLCMWIRNVVDLVPLACEDGPLLANNGSNQNAWSGSMMFTLAFHNQIFRVHTCTCTLYNNFWFFFYFFFFFFLIFYSQDFQRKSWDIIIACICPFPCLTLHDTAGQISTKFTHHCITFMYAAVLQTVDFLMIIIAQLKIRRLSRTR